MEFLIPSHPLTNFETQKYYENEPMNQGLMVFIREVICLKQQIFGHT